MGRQPKVAHGRTPEGDAMKLLLIEDDAALGRSTVIGLEQDGHEVKWVTTGGEGLALARTQEFDCLLLDLGLPDLSGEECLRTLRATRDTTPVIVLTARGMVGDRIGLLDQGADDYIVKPYDLDEIGARIRAVARRARSGEDQGEQAHGPLRLMPVTRTAMWHERPVTLTNKEFWILDTLMRGPGDLHSRAQLERVLYGHGEEVGSNAVEVHVHHLRRKLPAGLIQTVRGAGYRLCPADQLGELPATVEAE
jgi:DNA-binding response OmpR family regulator